MNHLVDYSLLIYPLKIYYHYQSNDSSEYTSQI